MHIPKFKLYSLNILNIGSRCIQSEPIKSYLFNESLFTKKALNESDWSRSWIPYDSGTVVVVNSSLEGRINAAHKLYVRLIWCFYLFVQALKPWLISMGTDCMEKYDQFNSSKCLLLYYTEEIRTIQVWSALVWLHSRCSALQCKAFWEKCVLLKDKSREFSPKNLAWTILQHFWF